MVNVRQFYGFSENYTSLPHIFRSSFQVETSFYCIRKKILNIWTFYKVHWLYFIQNHIFSTKCSIDFGQINKKMSYSFVLIENPLILVIFDFPPHHLISRYGPYHMRHLLLRSNPELLSHLYQQERGGGFRLLNWATEKNTIDFASSFESN